ncbi:DUF2189 domain-containing protein [Aurantiacibacter sp. MUD61]|uniref:DUF2189 domain-containing protein n=1 Tax=Aurantiacibacter sp. MUD61 TaxID=3009083 RepID=UPI0022F01078|nr:DUF2189 domain-containing protein [Aurantiacibacter sp. MUD61]
MHETGAGPAVRIAKDLSFSDLHAALVAGWRDFAAAPLFGLFFAAIYVATGVFLYLAVYSEGEVVWWIAAIAGFPLVAPFTAVGLYEVSRRREQSLPMRWSAVLGALNGRGDQQLLLMGGILFVAFSFWVIIAHGIFAIFMAESGMGGESLTALATPVGLAMLAVGSVVGALICLFFYVITVISLPMLVDRDVDFISAIIASMTAFRDNRTVLIGWAITIAGLLFLAMVPAFLGLFIALPVLGYATWHLYRRTVS